MLQYITIGAFLGLSAGCAPGPLLALVVAETLRQDVSSGIRVALAPVLTDVPIILLTVFLFSRLSASDFLLGVVSLVGGCVLLWMAWENLHARGLTPQAPESTNNALLKGVLANALSPHPYLFWLSVGGSAMGKALHQGAWALIGFLGGFYFFLVGSKIVLAWVTSRSKAFLRGQVYRSIMRFLGLALAALAFSLFYDGLHLIGVLGR